MSLVIKNKTVEADKLTASEPALYKYLKYKKIYPTLKNLFKEL